MTRRTTGSGRLLGRTFYARPTLEVARELLGCRLVRRLEGGMQLVGRIVETEAYIGGEDRACHASAGLTARNAVMFGRPGRAYVYLIYGMYHMLNVVTERSDCPAAVLIRAVEPLEGLERMAGLRGIEETVVDGPPRARARLTAGPGRLCQAFDIDRRLNGVDLRGGELSLRRGPPPARIEATPRIGVDYAGAWRTKPWRFIAGDDPYVSRRSARSRCDA